MADRFLVTAVVEGMVEHERRSVMQLMRLIQPWAGVDPTGVLGMWEVAHEVSRRVSRPQPTDGDHYNLQCSCTGSGYCFGPARATYPDRLNFSESLTVTDSCDRVL